MLIGSETRSPVTEAVTEPVIEPVTEPVESTTESTELTNQVRGRRRQWILATIAVVAVAIIVIELVALLSARGQVHDLKANEAARAGALAAARTYSIEVAGYDYRQLDKDFGTVEANSTAGFRSQFQASAAALKPVLTQYHAVAQARIVAAGLESVNATHAMAAVFIDQTVTNTTQKNGPTTDQSRLEITLVRQHGRWLIEQLKLL